MLLNRTALVFTLILITVLLRLQDALPIGGRCDHTQPELDECGENRVCTKDDKCACVLEFADGADCQKMQLVECSQDGYTCSEDFFCMLINPICYYADCDKSGYCIPLPER